MPLGQWFTLSAQAVSTSIGQPRLTRNIGGYRYTTGHQLITTRVFGATNSILAQILTAHTGVIQLIVVIVLQLNSTTTAAAVAQRLPLLSGKLFQRVFFPHLIAHLDALLLNINLHLVEVAFVETTLALVVLDVL